MSVYAAYAFNEGSGSTIIDYSGNARNMTVAGTNTWVAGHSNYSNAFQAGVNGTDGATWDAGSAQAALSGDVSLMLWYKHTAGTNTTNSHAGGLYSAASTARLSAWSYRSLLAVASSPQLTVRDSAGTIASVGVNTTVADSNWHHVAVVYHASGTIEEYLDGTLVFTVTPSANPIGVNVRFIGVGGILSGTPFSQAVVQDLRVFDAALTSSDVTAFMNTPVVSSAASTSLSNLIRATPYPLNLITKLNPQIPSSTAVSTPTIPVIVPQVTTPTRKLSNRPYPQTLTGIQQQNPASIPVVAVTGLTASTNVVANLGGSFNTPQNTFVPTHGWPYFSRRYIVNPNKPITFFGGLKASVNVQANFGTLVVSDPGITANVNVSANFGGVISVPETTALPTHGWPYFSKRYIVTPNRSSGSGFSGSVSSVTVTANLGVVKESVPGVTTAVNAVAFSGPIFIFQAQSKTAPFPVSTPYPLNITTRLKPQHTPSFPVPLSSSIGLTSHVTVQALTGVDKVSVTVANAAVNAVAAFGSIVIVTIAKTSIQQFPFSNITPYPLNIIYRIRPQRSGPAGGAARFVLGNSAIVNVTAFSGSTAVSSKPVHQWKIKLVRQQTGKLYSNIRYNPR